jgi:hypothetical protein
MHPLIAGIAGHHAADELELFFSHLPFISIVLLKLCDTINKQMPWQHEELLLNTVH